jgi:hypothetical protein
MKKVSRVARVTAVNVQSSTNVCECVCACVCVMQLVDIVVIVTSKGKYTALM